MSNPLNQVETHHQVVLIGTDLMELRDNENGSVIATASRPDATSNWKIKVTRDGTLEFTETTRTAAYMSMINNGPAGVSEGAVGYSTLTPHGIDDLP